MVETRGLKRRYKMAMVDSTLPWGDEEVPLNSTQMGKFDVKRLQNVYFLLIQCKHYSKGGYFVVNVVYLLMVAYYAFKMCFVLERTNALVMTPVLKGFKS